MQRRKTRQVRVGKLTIGSEYPVIVQSMTNTDTKDVKATMKQIESLEKGDCEIVRLAVYDEGCIEPLKEIRKRANIPLVADIHYDYKLAIESIKAGVDKVRINPGNIGDDWKVKEIIKVARDKGVAIRVGVNGGSVKEKYLDKKGHVTYRNLLAEAFDNVKLFESERFQNLVFSIKSSDVLQTIEANREFARQTDYPLHLGVTEAGIGTEGIVYSSVGIGTLLSEGIGDTIRVSLTGDPLQELDICWMILDALHIRKRKGIRLISCPTCARTNVNLGEVIAELKEKLPVIDMNLRVAVMGCVVNGIGEGKEADIGVAYGKSKAVIFKKGKILRTVNNDEVVNVMVNMILNTFDRPQA
ncbi:MAG: flavodoxin-dependent (E)-4-hydroxy-3-methylbut-2-enyl-diphosphate synthase [Thermotogae bacterium]|nr:flavodoxin-dependent (E)-4-hydroxy-3-methylbut-2-enyl-diphosphate synthase [Thermotogota bacterium]